MNEKTLKAIIGMYILSIVALLQLVAWYFGFNGQVFAFTSLIIGGITGTLLGFSLKKQG